MNIAQARTVVTRIRSGVAAGAVVRAMGDGAEQAGRAGDQGSVLSRHLAFREDQAAPRFRDAPFGAQRAASGRKEGGLRRADFARPGSRQIASAGLPELRLESFCAAKLRK